MANKKTRLARKHGFASLKDMQNNGTKIVKGTCVDTSWDNPNSKHRVRKIYKKQILPDYTD